jgi:transposase
MAKRANEKFQLSTSRLRTFSEAFKKEKVSDIKKGQLSIRDLCQLYNVSRASVYKWLHLYGEVEVGTKTVVQMESEEQKTKMLLQRVAELERVVGQKQLEIDYLNCCLSVASEEFGYDIKKKYAPTHLSDLGYNGTTTSKK